MNFNEFKQEVNNNRPRLALVYLVPVLEELIASNKAMAEELAAVKCECECHSVEESSLIEETVEEKTPVKKAPAKKAAAKKSAAKSTNEDSEEEKSDAE